MDIQSNKTWIDRLIWLLTLTFLSLSCILTEETYGSIVLLGCAVLIFLLSAMQTKWRVWFELDRFHWQWLAFGCYCLVSALWAWVPSEAIRRGSTIIQVLMCVVLMYIYYQDQEDLWQLYDAVRWSGVVVSIYAIYYYGIDVIMLSLTEGERLESSFANINTVGIMAAISVVVTLYEVFFRRRNWLALILSLTCLVTIAASGTRKALVVIMLGIALLIYFRYKSRDFIKTTLKILGMGALVIAVMAVVLSLPMFSGIMERMESFVALITGSGEADSSSLERSRFIEIGLEQFWKTPIFGIGIGNSGALLVKNFERNTYLHNNYVELLACGGIVGLLLFYSMYGYCLWFFCRNRSSGDPLINLGIVLILVMMAMDFARVSYYSKPTMFYMMIFFLQARQIKNRGAAQ